LKDEGIFLHSLRYNQGQKQKQVREGVYNEQTAAYIIILVTIKIIFFFIKLEYTYSIL